MSVFSNKEINGVEEGRSQDMPALQPEDQESAEAP